MLWEPVNKWDRTIHNSTIMECMTNKIHRTFLPCKIVNNKITLVKLIHINKLIIIK